MDIEAPRSGAEPLAQLARNHWLAGREEDARRALAQLIGEVAGGGASRVAINRDVYSLNSLNGMTTLADGTSFFFKFHAEEGEEETIQEYYNAELLQETGYPVDVPVFACGEPGRQILLYRFRADLRFSDVCRDWEADGSLPEDVSLAGLIAAQEELDRISGERMISTLHDAEASLISTEPVNRLFRDRLVDADGDAEPGAGGRVARFYAHNTHRLGGVALTWEELRDARWEINGVEYAETIGQIFSDAAETLTPDRLGPAAVVAHGDAHNANVWYECADGLGDGRLIQFDPAFAGRHMPALLAEVKATFHNIFAHPFWLYEPAIATLRCSVDVERLPGGLRVRHDLEPGALRESFLASKATSVWRPLLKSLRDRGQLPVDWRRLIRRAMFCCPTLVQELRAGGATGHTSVSAAIGWAVAVAAGSAPTTGRDMFTAFLDSIDPETPEC